MSADEVMSRIEEEGVEFLQLWFSDLSGKLKGFDVPVSEVEKGFEKGFGFDGSSIEGFSRIQESDMLAIPDPDTFKLLPWTAEDESIPPRARMFCDVHHTYEDNPPYLGYPRHILQRTEKKAAEMGFDEFYAGPEIEFFIFEDDQGTETLDRESYFDITGLNQSNDLRMQIIDHLEKIGINVPYSHHEVAPSQHEINMTHRTGTEMADQCITYKYVVKEVASRNGVYATFMPKPISDENGSGMHTHQSLYRDGENAFYDPDGRFFLSETAEQYIAGIIEHIHEIVAVTNPWPNSYKRLVPGYEAPVYVSWGARNRSALIRLPAYDEGEEAATRLELRFPDPSCNPYLAFASMLAAGLKGIEEGYELEEPTTDNIYEMSDAELKDQGIEQLPGSLGEAINNFEQSDLMRETFGEEAFEHYIREKRFIWDEYRQNVTDFEIEEYLPLL